MGPAKSCSIEHRCNSHQLCSHGQVMLLLTTADKKPCQFSLVRASKMSVQCRRRENNADGCPSQQKDRSALLLLVCRPTVVSTPRVDLKPGFPAVFSLHGNWGNCRELSLQHKSSRSSPSIWIFAGALSCWRSWLESPEAASAQDSLSSAFRAFCTWFKS